MSTQIVSSQRNLTASSRFVGPLAVAILLSLLFALAIHSNLEAHPQTDAEIAAMQGGL